jgi:hypothetical protein
MEDKTKQKSIFIFRFSESISDRTQVVDSQKFSTGNNAFTALFPALSAESLPDTRDPCSDIVSQTPNSTFHSTTPFYLSALISSVSL